MPQSIYRKATQNDILSIMRIMEQAKALMQREGRNQWDEGYPAVEHIMADIASGFGRVFACDDEILVYAAVVYGEEPAYEHIDGQWLSTQPYVVVHRLAVNDRYRQQGLATAFMREVIKHSAGKVGSFRIDTNFDNTYMLRMLDAFGFTYCGKIHYESGERLAFEKLI